ncbi:MAG: exonuclease SbcCD subunit D, partial [Turicibacter sp.]
NSERNVLITHAFVTGGGDAQTSESEKSLVVGGKEDIALSLFNDFDYVALGHLHGAQRVGSNKVRYSGTPLKYSISEEHHKKSVTLIELKEKDDLTIELLPLKPLRDMRTIKGTLEELTKTHEVIGKYDYLRVILTDDGELIEPMAKLRAVYPNVMSLEFSANRGSFNLSNLTSEARKSKSPSELFADFYEHAKGEPLGEEKQRVLEETIKQLIGGTE